MIVYVDDIILTINNNAKVERLKKSPANDFEIKDLGALKNFLRTKFARSKEYIFVNQSIYILDLLG